MILNALIVKDLKRVLIRKNKKHKYLLNEKMKIYRCKRCNYLYIDGEQKTPFENVGNQWKCPKCRSSKKFFVEKEISDKS